MSNAVRSWLLLLVTLCLGIALGVLGGGAMQERRAARVNEMRRPAGIVDHIRNVIQPTSDSQWASIRPMVEAMAVRHGEMRQAHEQAILGTLDTLRAQLNPLLTPAQRERLSTFVPLRPGSSRPSDGPPGAGPGQRGPRPDDRGPPPGDQQPPPPRP
jgi:hypothetical protein